jgi:hypothetical protein
LTPPKRPSSDTAPIDREALFDELEARGEVVRCPCCHVGRISPRLAARVELALPKVDRDAPTPPEFPAAKVAK